MIDPAYHDIQADQIPIVELEDGKVKVISGTFQDATGPGRPHTGMMYLDVHLNSKQDIRLPIEMVGTASSTFMKVQSTPT